MTNGDVEISPEPSEEEREAVERALARLLGEPDGGATAWWREGIRENVLGEESEPVSESRRGTVLRSETDSLEERAADG